MKIGILTYHRAHNYGALMQAIALRFVLQKLGHEVYYVDYWPMYHEVKYIPFSLHLLSLKELRKGAVVKRLYYTFRSVFLIKIRKERYENFNKFINCYIEPFCRPLSDTYDVVVYGSDQIWRKQWEIGGYNPTYFGCNKIKALKHISYAASLGEIPSKDVDVSNFKKLVTNLDGISVRETKLQEFLINIGFENVKLCIDPTLLLSAVEWNTIIKDVKTFSKPYVLHYYITKTGFNRDEINAFARKHGLTVIELRGIANQKETENVFTTKSPETFLSLIKNASYVFTSSFHGLVFSLLYHKQFYASYREFSERAESIMNLLNLQSHLLTPMSELCQCDDIIDYSIIDSKLEALKEDSFSYLKNI